MSSLCTLCTRTPAREDCYVRIEREERPTCRPCWEQLLLDPRRVLRSMRGETTRARRNPSAS
jgi:hypothetical protein